ncbi:hypothetical protein T484DRAFT_1795575 [Baffinella frigidus]|nr:hypothetical protein T484DRAFT_1795575 [Cryptophyta sp. CCMP2293]
MAEACARGRDTVVRRRRCSGLPLTVVALLLTAVLPGQGAGGSNLQAFDDVNIGRVLSGSQWAGGKRAGGLRELRRGGAGGEREIGGVSGSVLRLVGGGAEPERNKKSAQQREKELIAGCKGKVKGGGPAGGPAKLLKADKGGGEGSFAQQRITAIEVHPAARATHPHNAKS